MALPRGGVIVAKAVAEAFGAPLDIVISRRLSAPSYPEFGIGAIGEEGVRHIDALAMRLLGLKDADIVAAEEEQRLELKRRIKLYRGDNPLHPVAGRTVILVDDGLASGMTAKAALAVLKKHSPKRLILAVPVASPDKVCVALNWADDVVCVATPPDFQLVNDWYADFSDVPEGEVLAILAAAKNGTRRKMNGTKNNPETAYQHLDFPTGVAEIEIPAPTGNIAATLALPESSRGMVLIVHGAGSSRDSPRSRVIAHALEKIGLATLRIDLLTSAERAMESETRHLRFNVGLLTERVMAATQYLLSHPVTKKLPLAYIGASTGASAMLATASRFGEKITVIVSRGGRPELVEPLLPKVTAPTLLLVGGRDNPVLDGNERALARLGSTDKKLVIIDGATHLFEEPGAMGEVVRLTTDWLNHHLS